MADTVMRLRGKNESNTVPHFPLSMFMSPGSFELIALKMVLTVSEFILHLDCLCVDVCVTLGSLSKSNRGIECSSLRREP